MDIYCTVCGNLFTPKDREQRLCSWKCRGKWAALIRPARVEVERPCSKCGKPVLSKGRNLAYCEACRNPERTCRQCGISFHKVDRLRSPFCSRSCAGKYGKRDVPTGAAHWNYKGVDRPYATHGWFLARDATRTRDGWRCVDCGRERPAVKLNVHHLIARKNWGGRDGHPDDLDNLVTVCTSCHKKRHPTSHEGHVAGWKKRRATATSA